ncbi:hypothetical protein [Massilia sp. DWR3-1-1]|uniref:hypothetical protein n=1 Tax=Massilia sp. DWR3-1-1 TaxID=2804559 RepID=UPI003CE70082
MADFPVTTLTKANPSYNAFNTGGVEALRASASRDTAAAVNRGTDATGGGPIFRLPRNEVWLLPPLVTDRFGNSVPYTCDPAHPGKLMSITSSQSPSRTITLTHAGPDANGFMRCRRSATAAEPAARLAPVNQRITSQQGATFTWTAGEFDEYAHPRLVTRTSSLNPGRSERTVFDNHIGRWIPGQTTSVTEINTNKVMVLNVINASTGLIESVSQFGHLNQSMTYNTDGTLLTKSDGLQHATRFDNWKRGIPRSARRHRLRVPGDGTNGAPGASHRQHRQGARTDDQSTRPGGVSGPRVWRPVPPTLAH